MRPVLTLSCGSSSSRSEIIPALNRGGGWGYLFNIYILNMIEKYNIPIIFHCSLGQGRDIMSFISGTIQDMFIIFFPWQTDAFTKLLNKSNQIITLDQLNLTAFEAPELCSSN